jgi:O-antigen/teichoic acid export membrane protein
VGIVARVISVFCTLAQVPIALRYLGADGFGLWMTLNGIAGLLLVADLGLSLGAKTIIAQAFGRGDVLGCQAIARESFIQAAKLGAAVAIVGTALAWAFDWRTVLGPLSPGLAQQLPWALTALAFCAGAALPTGIGVSLAAAVQLTWVQHLATAVGGALTLLIVAAGAAANLSWLTIVIACLALPAVINASIGWGVLRHLGWRTSTPSSASVAQRRELWHLSRWFLLPQLGSLFMVLSVPVVIAGFGGPIAVAAFNLLQRVFGIVNQAHWMALLALWPAYGDAHARSDYSWMKAAYRKSWQATVLLFVPGTVILAALMPLLVRFWVGAGKIDLSPTLVWVSAAWFVLQLLGQPPAVLLNGVGRLRTVALYGTLGHLLSLVLMVVGGRMAGPSGVVAGMTIGYFLIGFPITLTQAGRALKEPLRD